jgi:hypothetical protein
MLLHSHPFTEHKIVDMALVSRGRLSVQRVDGNAWDTIALLAEKGGWDGLRLSGTKSKAPKVKAPRGKKKTEEGEGDNNGVTGFDHVDNATARQPTSNRKRKVNALEEGADNSLSPLRRSSRARK